MSQALIVVDMQNAFCHPDGSLPRIDRPLEGVAGAVAGCVQAVGDARRAGIPVVYTRHLYRPGYADAGPNFDLLGAPLREIGGLLAGSWDGAIIDELGAGADDLVVDKCRYDAFLGTSLDLLLGDLGVDQVAVCGVVTNVCVESTVRSAFMRDYAVTVLADACAAQSVRLHEVALEVFEACRFANVCRLAEGYRLGQVAVPA